ncbi:hypothetical protein WH50_06355 [Pokkaliibacter plantistimulans]|uniref:Uncharacterized protein n=1 Tax=Pokkaliibacter plantistimulans TaxID=1635171 RepID=A0ABX5LZK1_9GAMM|nr:hypothetical protein WH50_06355 [Pokkaliibacter plantistimulans]
MPRPPKFSAPMTGAERTEKYRKERLMKVIAKEIWSESDCLYLLKSVQTDELRKKAWIRLGKINEWNF